MKLNKTNKKITSLLFSILMITSVFAVFVTPVMANPIQSEPIPGNITINSLGITETVICTTKLAALPVVTREAPLIRRGGRKTDIIVTGPLFDTVLRENSSSDFRVKEQVSPLQDLKPKIDSLLEAEIRARPAEKIPIIIVMKEQQEQLKDVFGEFYVQRAKLLAEASQTLLLSSLNEMEIRGEVENVEQFWIINAISAEVKADQIDNIAQRADVEKVWLDSKVYLIEPVVFPLWTAEDYGDGLIGADIMWDTRLNGTGINISILDTGINASHPDLGARVILERDFTDSIRGTLDINGHGTHVAGIAAGARNTTSGVSGVAYNASIFNAKVLSDAGPGYTSWIIAGIEWSVGNHADVVCMSLGGWQSDGTGKDPLSVAVTNAVTTGVVVVIAAGNEGPGEATIGNPAVAYGAIAVAASNRMDAIARFSSRGPTGDGRVGVDITAPGVDIRAPRAQWEDGRGLYVNYPGTSMAAPHVAGAAALLLQVNPFLTPGKIEKALKNTADDISNVLEQGAGRLDIKDAYDALTNGTLVEHEWYVGKVYPSVHTKIFTVMNKNTTADVTLSIAEIVMTDTRGVVAGDWLTAPASVTMPSGASTTFTVMMNVPPTAVGTYIGSITLVNTTNVPMTNITIPISVNVMQRVDNITIAHITGTVDEDSVVFRFPYGDWVYYTIDIQIGVANLNLSLNWINATNDLDLYLFNTKGELIASSVWFAKPETISVVSPEAGNWTVAINAWSLTTLSETYNLIVMSTPPPPTSITLTPSTVTLNVNATQRFNAIVLPTGADSRINWSVVNTTVGTINATGFFTAISVGTTNVTARSVVERNITRNAIVTVVAPVIPPTSITVAPPTARINVTENITFSATVLPAAANQSVTWSVVNATVGTITPTGVFTAHAAGTTNVTARSVVDANIIGTAIVTVVAPVLGDANGDGRVNIADFGILAASFGRSRGEAGFDSRANFNGDGIVNIADFGILAANFGR